MHNYLLYYLVILPISILPYPVLYLVSDFFRFFIYHVFGYRKKVVFANLRNSFPEKSEKEIKKIARVFYKHFCDIVFESLKCFTISEKSLRKRMVFRNPELVNAYYDKGQSIIMVGGHYNNWELWAVAVGLHVKHKNLGIYKPLKNVFFDKKMKKTRQRFGILMIPIKAVKKYFEDGSGTPISTIFASDQSPGKAKKAHWMEFLNQDTGVPFGAEKYAKEYNLPVVFGIIYRMKRGHYEVEFTTITDQPQETRKGEITETFTKMLEADIRKDPPFWLWTHKRWKRKRPDDYEL
jgi:KDO2-lipid IV(A) lauroyltransferase